MGDKCILIVRRHCEFYILSLVFLINSESCSFKRQKARRVMNAMSQWSSPNVTLLFRKLTLRHLTRVLSRKKIWGNTLMGKFLLYNKLPPNQVAYGETTLHKYQTLPSSPPPKTQHISVHKFDTLQCLLGHSAPNPCSANISWAHPDIWAAEGCWVRK